MPCFHGNCGYIRLRVGGMAAGFIRWLLIWKDILINGNNSLWGLKTRQAAAPLTSSFVHTERKMYSWMHLELMKETFKFYFSDLKSLQVHSDEYSSSVSSCSVLVYWLLKEKSTPSCMSVSFVRCWRVARWTPSVRDEQQDLVFAASFSLTFISCTRSRHTRQTSLFLFPCSFSMFPFRFKLARKTAGWIFLLAPQRQSFRNIRHLCGQSVKGGGLCRSHLSFSLFLLSLFFE